MTERTQWQETIEELKREPLSEGVRDYLKKFFTKKSAPAPTPPPAPPAPGSPVVPDPAASQKYIQELNQILRKHQKALITYAAGLNTRVLKKKFEELDFLALPHRPERPKSLDVTDPIKPIGTPKFTGPPGAKSPFSPPAPTPPAPPPATGTKKKKSKDDLPYNSIFTEAQSREWKPRINGLNQVMADAYQEVRQFLLEIAKASGYTPKNSNDIKALVSEMKHFTILDKQTLHILRTKLIGFMITYRTLEGYAQWFQRTYQAQIAAEKKAAKQHIP